MMKFSNRFTPASGGECRESWSEVINTTWVPKTKNPPPPPGPAIFVDGIGEHEYKDTGGNTAAGEEIELGKAVVAVMEQTSGFNLGNITIPEGSNIARALKLTPEQLGLTDEEQDPQDEFIETSTKINQLRAANHRMSKRLAQTKYGVIDSESMKLVWGEAYAVANQIIGTRPGDRHFIRRGIYKETNDIQIIDAVASALRRLFQEVSQ